MRPQERAASSCVHWLPSISATPRSILAAALSFACVFSLTFEIPVVAAIPAAAKDKKKTDPGLKGLPITELSSDEAILHALNRLAYGPRPGDVERVRQMGLAKWIEQQLNPNAIDDRGVEARLEQFPTLRMSTAKLLAEYPQPKQAEKQAIKQGQTEPRSSNSGAAGVANASEAASTATNENAPSPMKQESRAEMNAATRGTGKRDLL